jgi:hypothetical protein
MGLDLLMSSNSKNKTSGTKSSFLTRFPYTHGEMLNDKLQNKKIEICPNPEGTQPVRYNNYRGDHPMGGMIRTEGPNTVFYLNWYVWEFLGHLHYLSNDFTTFISQIAENENRTGPSKNDFTKYFTSMLSDSTSVYNKHIYAHFQVMWMKCNGNQETWNTMLSQLRNDFNEYIQMRMITYETDTDKVHSVFGNWKDTLEPIYGDEWGSYLWQCANFDELGHFISDHNSVFRKNEIARNLLCHLNIPEETYDFAGLQNQKVATIDDDSNILIWARGVEHDGKMYAYPATPDVWTTGSHAIMPSVSTTRHTSIFQNNYARTWLRKCKEKGVDVKFLLMESDSNEILRSHNFPVVPLSNKAELSRINFRC